jgi:hypothetical protein
LWYLTLQCLSLRRQDRQHHHNNNQHRQNRQHRLQLNRYL